MPSSKPTPPQSDAHADTLSVVKQFLAERLDIDPAQVVPQARLDEMGIDSLMFAEMLFELEDRLHTTIDVQSSEQMPETVAALLTVVERYRALANGGKAAPAP